MIKPWAWYQTSSLVVIVTGMLSILSFIVISQIAVAGYGYGYGYGTCLVNPPHNLKAMNQPGRHRVKLYWLPASYMDCGVEFDHYELEVVKGGLPVYAKATKNSTTFINYGVLRGPGNYTYHVRAHHSDGSVTAWSAWQAFTL